MSPREDFVRRYQLPLIIGGVACVVFLSCGACCTIGLVANNSPEGRRMRAERDAERERNRPAPPEKNKITRENYEKILVNMPVDRVENILGPGTETMSGQGFMVLTWSSWPTSITITFGPGNLVQSKSMIGG